MRVLPIAMWLVTSMPFAWPAPQAVDGRWIIAIEAASRKTPDGGSISRRAFNGTLTLATEGASLRGTLALTGQDGDGRPVTGRMANGRLQLATDWREIEGTNNDQPVKMRVRWVLEGSLVGDTLSGTCRTELEGRDTVDQPWTAKRAGLH